MPSLLDNLDLDVVFNLDGRRRRTLPDSHTFEPLVELEPLVLDRQLCLIQLDLLSL